MTKDIKKGHTVLFVSHKKAKCGVYEFGRSISDVLAKSQKINFVRVECASLNELKEAIITHNPGAIIYNYYPSVMPWIADKLLVRFYRNNLNNINIPQIGIIHEVTQEVADKARQKKGRFLFGKSKMLINSLFDFYIVPDPTIVINHPFIYKTGRLIPFYQNHFPAASKTTIGSFGFGTPNKGFEDIVRLVQNEFDDAIIRFNIPFAEFGDKDGTKARAIAENCKAIIKKKGIELIITHDFFDKQSMLDFLAKNTINVFLYEDMSGRGLSSTIENALAVKRPVAISDSVMFRHISTADPSIQVSKKSLSEIIGNGVSPLVKFYEEWNEQTILSIYERIILQGINDA